MEHKRVKSGGDAVTAGRGARVARRPRRLTDEAMREIAEALKASPAIVLSGQIVGGEDRPTGVMLSLAYEGDDIPACGADILFWLRWQAAHGDSEIRPPRVIVNDARELPELVRLELDFGDVEASEQASAPGMSGVRRWQPS
jgi:hypothetical protein